MAWLLKKMRIRNFDVKQIPSNAWKFEPLKFAGYVNNVDTVTNANKIAYCGWYVSLPLHVVW